MSDTVKIIVELSKGQYERLQNIPFGSIGSKMIYEAIKKGKPLSEVLRDIEQEVYDLKEKCDACEYLGCGIIEIIDKHKGKAESEDISHIFDNVTQEGFEKIAKEITKGGTE